jgi:protein-S-isoprenylcysteine O-methyltransferase Ste14
MEYAYGNWLLVIVNIAIFLAFVISSFKPRNKTDWRTFNMFAAFVVSLFAEMYGFPLTIYLLVSFFSRWFPNLSFTHSSGHLLIDVFGFKGDPHTNIIHLLSNLFIFGGLILLSNAWKILYQANLESKIANSGIYRHIRHPQYTAFILIIIGFLLQWPTIITLTMAPILIFRYIRLSQSEEKYMIKKFGQSYTNYQKNTSQFVPLFRKLV